MVKEVCIHEITVALIMGGLQTHIFIQIHAVYAGEVQPFLAAAACKLLVHPNRA